MGMSIPTAYTWYPTLGFVATVSPNDYDNGEIYSGLTSVTFAPSDSWRGGYFLMIPEQIDLTFRNTGNIGTCTITVYDESDAIIGVAPWTGQTNVSFDITPGLPLKSIAITADINNITTSGNAYLDDIQITFAPIAAGGPGDDFWTMLVDTTQFTAAAAGAPLIGKSAFQRYRPGFAYDIWPGSDVTLPAHDDDQNTSLEIGESDLSHFAVSFGRDIMIDRVEIDFVFEGPTMLLRFLPDCWIGTGSIGIGGQYAFTLPVGASTKTFSGASWGLDVPRNTVGIRNFYYESLIVKEIRVFEVEV